MLWESLHVSVVDAPVVDSQSFLLLSTFPQPQLSKRCRRAHSGDETVKIKMLADQPTEADVYLHYVCVLHTVITFGQAPVWNQHSWLFRKLTHPFNTTTVNCSGRSALTEALYICVWSRYTRNTVSVCTK